mmetsp:Transcript_28761/g.58899  ORF Transcript_28761/g.58899 Transcript_28761/m.58899 type:complete len:260 (-) Transcript_28761:64-843(-)
MGAHPMPERLDVGLESIPGLDPLLLQYLQHQVGVVAALRSGADLLSAEEDVVGVGEARIVGIGHGVEWADGGGVFVEHEEVGAVLFLHCCAKGEFHGTRQVSHFISHIKTLPLEDLHRLRPVKDAGLVGDGDRFRRVLLPNSLQLLGVSALQPVEYVLERPVDHLQGLEVVILDRHLEVQSRELAQVTARVGILGPEHGTDLEHPIQVGRYRHLLVKLRALREARGGAEVVGREDSRAALGLAGDELGGVNLDEAQGVE